jgi:hypothetical protein
VAACQGGRLVVHFTNRKNAPFPLFHMTRDATSSCPPTHCLRFDPSLGVANGEADFVVATISTPIKPTYLASQRATAQAQLVTAAGRLAALLNAIAWP